MENQISTNTDKLLNWLNVFGPKILSALLVFVIGLYITNWLAHMVSKSLNKQKVDQSLQSFLSSMVSVALKVLLLVTVAGMLGIQTTSFVAVIGALGLAVGLALQGSLSNFAGGVLVLVFKPFKAGDLIEACGQTGVVQEIQIFNTVLLTPDHKTVILANGAVSNGTIINYSKHGSLRVDLVFAIAAEESIDRARKVAMDVMLKSELVLKVPAPSVNVLKVNDGMVTLAVRPYCEQDKYWDAYFTVQEAIKLAFDEHKIAAPVPTSITYNK